jgi:hypothetical protein
MGKTTNAKFNSRRNCITDGRPVRTLGSEQQMRTCMTRLRLIKGRTLLAGFPCYCLCSSLCLLACSSIIALGSRSRETLSCRRTGNLVFGQRRASGWRRRFPARAIKEQGWHPIHRMPATVLEILQEDGVYPDLYFGKQHAGRRPRRTCTSRTGGIGPCSPRRRDYSNYSLEFPGINYRAEIWINGHEKVANQQADRGMYAAHQLDVTRWIHPGSANVLAVKVTPEQLIQDVDGIELADSWFDWLNYKYLGYHGANSQRLTQFGALLCSRSAMPASGSRST